MTTKLSGRLVNDNTVSPLDFGAVGDGSTDDTAAVNRAIDQLSSGSKILDLNNKTYKVTTQLNTIGVGGVIIRNGAFKYEPNTANRGKPMLKITVAQADEVKKDLLSSSKSHPGTKQITTEGTVVNVADGSYLWLEQSDWDFVYKGKLDRPEDQFPRSDRAFKGEMLKVDWSDKTGANYIYYLDNEVNLYYDGAIGNNTTEGVGVKILTTLDDIVFENVDIEGPGIVRKKIATGGYGSGGSAGTTIANGVRTVEYGSTDHGLTNGEYYTIDTQDWMSGSVTVATPIQGVWKITSDPGSGTTLTSAGLDARRLQHAAVDDPHNLLDKTDTGQIYHDTWIYTRNEIALSVEYCSNFKMTNCKITGFGEAGVVTMKCYEPEFANCLFENLRPEGSGGLVIGNGNYSPYIHDCEFKGYTGVTLGTTGMKVLMDMSELNVSFYGTVMKPVVKNNTFKVKEIGVNIRENTFHSDVSDNVMDLSSTFAQERLEKTHSNRVLSTGVHCRGVFTNITRNTIKGVMKYGVYHRQGHKVSYNSDAIFDDGVGTVDVGDDSALNTLFADPSTWSTGSNQDAEQGSVGLGNELSRFDTNIVNNTITALYNVPSVDIPRYSNLMNTSIYGIWSENQTIGQVNLATSWSSKITIKDNKVSGHLASIRLRLINGRYKGVSITENSIDTTPYLDRAAGGLGQYTTDSYGSPHRPGRGLGGLYNDISYETDSTLSIPTHREGVQKASGICLMIENYDDYSTGGLVQPRIEDVDISNNILYRTKKNATTVPDSGDADVFSGGGTSTFSIWFDCFTGGGQVRHISVMNNRCHYTLRAAIVMSSRRSPYNLSAGSGDGHGSNFQYHDADSCSVRYGVLHFHIANSEQVEGDDGDWSGQEAGSNDILYTRQHTDDGTSFTSGLNINCAHYAAGLGTNSHGDLGNSFGAKSDGNNTHAYMGRLFNYLRWA